MRVCRVTYRASFIQPIGRLNPMGLKLKMPIEVEIFESKEGMWKARRPNTTFEFEEIPPTHGQESMKQTVKSCFEEQHSHWTMYGEKGRLLLPHEWVARDDKVYLLEPDDFTHMPKLETPQPDKRKGYPPAGPVSAHVAVMPCDNHPQYGDKPDCEFPKKPVHIERGHP